MSQEEAHFTLTGNTDEEIREYNKPLYGSHGQFSLTPGVTVPYFSTLMSISRVTSELKTHEEVSPSLDNTYTLEELFQRQIDIDRVKAEIVDGYLKAHNKLKFFNSITVALFPKDISGRITPTFEDYPNNNPQIPAEGAGDFDRNFRSDSYNRIIFGGVQYVKTQVANMARLRWDRSRVDAMAVDGQHRLIALKKWFDDKHKELTDLEKPTRISVIFLLLHENAGFERSTADETDSIKGIAREIFTDLNKNAKEVDLATQIVLDDRSLESRCVRSLVTRSTCEDSAVLLPLSLLRWREANNRFDNRHFLNSLINLHLIVKDLLGVQIPNNPMDASKVTSYIRNLEDCLGDEFEGKRCLRVNNKNLMDTYASDYFDAEADDPNAPVRPFIGIPSAYLPAAVEGFDRRYRPWMLTVLRDFKPYKELLNYARDNNLICGQFSQYLSQPESARAELMNTLESEHGDGWYRIVVGRHQEAIQRIKGTGDKDLGEQWAFKTIFQKAIMRLAKQISLQTPDEIERLGNVEDFISFLDDMYDRNILRVLYPLKGETHKFWTFITLNYGNQKISVSSASENRIESFLQIAYTGFRFAATAKKIISNTAADDNLTPRKVLSEISTQASHIEWRAHNACKTLLDLMADKATIIDASLGEREQEGEISGAALEKKKKEVGRDRLIALLSECWLPNNESPAQTDEAIEDDDGMI